MDLENELAILPIRCHLLILNTRRMQKRLLSAKLIHAGKALVKEL